MPSNLPLTAAEARRHVETILGHIDAVRNAVRSLDRRDGSKALGCASSHDIFKATRTPIPSGTDSGNSH